MHQGNALFYQLLYEYVKFKLQEQQAQSQIYIHFITKKSLSFQTKQSQGITRCSSTNQMMPTQCKQTSMVILFNLNIDGIFPLLVLDFRHKYIAVLHLSFDMVKLVEVVRRQVNLAIVARSTLFLVAFTFDNDSVLDLVNIDFHINN